MFRSVCVHTWLTFDEMRLSFCTHLLSVCTQYLKPLSVWHSLWHAAFKLHLKSKQHLSITVSNKSLCNCLTFIMSVHPRLDLAFLVVYVLSSPTNWLHNPKLSQETHSGCILIPGVNRLTSPCPLVIGSLRMDGNAGAIDCIRFCYVCLFVQLPSYSSFTPFPYRPVFPLWSLWLHFSPHPPVIWVLRLMLNFLLIKNILNKCPLKAAVNSTVWHRGSAWNLPLPVWFFCDCSSEFVLCPRSIFRVFSADRKRVETALENCNLPSGRVSNRKHWMSFLSVAVSLSPNPLPFVRLLLSLIAQLFHLLHPSISMSPLRSPRSLLSWHSRWLLLLLICLESYFLDACMTSHSELI